MVELRNCIICREEKSKVEMSDEHVIPGALGGYYHIYSVCRECNSFMGEKVDEPLVNHKLAQIYRLENKVKGKSGSIPNPFSDIVIDDEISNTKTAVRIDQSTGAIYTEYRPKIKCTPPNEDGIARLEVSVDVNNKRDTIDSIIDKHLLRNKIPKSAITSHKREIEDISGFIEFEYELDPLKFLIGLLKIAYEFATDVVPIYFFDEDAIKISKILKDADYQSAEAYCRYTLPVSTYFSNIYQALKVPSKSHLLLLLENTEGLFCIVKIGEIFSSIVTLSKRNNFIGGNESGWIVTNDPKSKKVEKMTLRDYRERILKASSN